MGVLKGNPKRGRPSKSDRLDQESIPCQVCLESAVRSIRRFFDIAGDMVNAEETGADHFSFRTTSEMINFFGPNVCRKFSSGCQILSS